jgi:hypothetical protein
MKTVGKAVFGYSRAWFRAIFTQALTLPFGLSLSKPALRTALRQAQGERSSWM